MAKAVKKEKSFEQSLWDSANALRGSVEASEYKHIVLSLIFLKYANDRFNERTEELIAEGKEAYLHISEFYTMKNVFYIPETSRWSMIMENSKQPNIATIIDTALSDIEKINKSLKGALPDNYYSRLNLEVSNLSSLLDEINKVDTLKDKENDIIGRVYEFFLKKFALQEGKGKGEFYTPKCIVNLLTELIQPYKGRIYDPACGSGGMFVQSMKFVQAHHGNTKDVSIYGQEYSRTTYKLCKMNLAIRGITADLGEKEANTFLNDQHKDLKADFILANPPFNQSKWRLETELIDDERWDGYPVPPTGNANYGWILNMISKLSCNGVAGFILANGSLSGGGDELAIRKQIIENHLVDAIIYLPRNLFYTTDIGVCLWIISNNKRERIVEIDGNPIKLRNRENEILFMDLRKWGSPFEKKYIEFTEDDIKKITKTYHDWYSVDGYSQYQDVPEYCKSINIADLKNYSLVPSEYIEFVNKDENINYEELMTELTGELQSLLKKEQKQTTELLKVLEDLGYEIKL